jgi:2-methylcitrate dehydratase PrpD
LWGLAERERASGAALIGAFVAGVEVECQLGRWLNPEHYARGFHATGTLGTFGAAAAAAHLLGLPEPLWLHAFGLAGTQAAGLKSAFGSMAKPLHAGRAAQTGLMSALLASGGFLAHPSILEADQGFFATHAGPRLMAAEVQPDGFALRDTLFKYHAACHLTHATIDGVRELMTRQHMVPDELASLEIVVDETCRGVCNIERPETGMQTKFSDRRAHSPELQRWLERVHVRFEPMPATRSELHAQLHDGRVLTTTSDSGIPERDLERQAQRLREKFARLAPLSAATAHAVVEWVWKLEEQPNLTELLGLIARG